MVVVTDMLPPLIDLTTSPPSSKVVLDVVIKLIDLMIFIL